MADRSVRNPFRRLRIGGRADARPIRLVGQFTADCVTYSNSTRVVGDRLLYSHVAARLYEGWRAWVRWNRPSPIRGRVRLRPRCESSKCRRKLIPSSTSSPIYCSLTLPRA